MALKKKLQVFISSTYEDLKEERQAAVGAILTAGHIPAGMELFAAGDESQMNVIKRWIDESEVFLLILGGRYGSIEPKSQKSYIQLEYEYALERGKALFAVVITEDHLEERVKKFGSKVIEREYPQKLKEFRSLVLTKLIKFWADPRDIKLTILETMAEFDHRSELVGWVPGNEAVTAGALAEEMARLAKENAELREQVKKLSALSATYNGLTFEEFYKLLAATKPKISDLGEENIKNLRSVADLFGDPEPALLHIFWMLSGGFRRKGTIADKDEENMIFAIKLEEFGLVERDEEESAKAGRGRQVYQLTECGKQFLLRLRLERAAEKAERFILP